MPMNPKPKTRSLFSFEFIAFCLIIVAAFCNISVFYSFFHYLGIIGVPFAWRGFLVGLEPMSAFVLRLLVIPWLHVRNAKTVLTISLLLLIATSCAYLWVTTVPAMIVLRIVHGAVFVLLTSAVIVLIVNFIPEEKTGQGFSAVSIATMIPYAVVPPLFEALLPAVRNEADIYAAVSIFSIAAIFLLAAVRKRIGDALGGMDGVLLRRPAFSEIRENFRRPSVFLLLLAAFLIFLAHATFFYFMKDLSLQIRTGDVGLFFTISITTMIAVRAFGAALFDRMDKLSTLLKSVPDPAPPRDLPGVLLPAGRRIRVMPGLNSAASQRAALFGFPAIPAGSQHQYNSVCHGCGLFRHALSGRNADHIRDRV
jgi:predicted MFS family arabinose efflux permease